MTVQVIERLSPNYWPYNNGYVAIVCHGTSGNLGASLGWLDNPASQASSNYMIDTNGDIYMLVSPYKGYSAWANGIVQKPDLSVPWLVDCVARGINLNTKTISIEHVATGPDMTAHNYTSMPMAQRKASGNLILQLCKDFKIPLTRSHIIGHYQIDSIDRPNCPGVIDLGPYVLDIIKEAVTSVATGTATNLDPYGDPGAWHCVQPGIDLWVIQPLLDYWRQHGGLVEFGYPVSGYRPMQGKPGWYCQYFERTRLEHNTATGEVTRGRIGAELMAALGDKAP